jgi:hypothetical protein
MPSVGTGRRDLAWLVGLVVALSAVLLWPYAVDGHPFGVGPDVPVYLWWTRVGASEGLSTIGSRPGAPALAAALAGTLNLNAAAVTAALASAIGVAVGTAGAALVRAGGARLRLPWVLAGLLAGVFSVHLLAGYLANLVLAACFLAAAACLAGDRRAWGAAALLLAGGGLAHLPFLVHAIVVLLGAAALAWRGGARDEARDVALASGVGGLVAGAGVLATLAGPGPLTVETSKDGYLRRAGLDAELVDAYRERFRLRAARYVQWVAVPLAIVGTSKATGFVRRFLLMWLVSIAVGVPIGWLTGWFPPDRLVTFGFAVPVAAALGLVRVHGRLSSRPRVAGLVVALAVGWMVVGAMLAWLRQSPFISIEQSRVAEAALLRAGSRMSVEDRPIVVVVDDGDTTATFLGARASNILRGAAQPDLVRDLSVFVGTVSDFRDGVPTVRDAAEFDALSRLTLEDATRRPDPLVIVLEPFYRGSDLTSEGLIEVEAGVWASDELPEVAIGDSPIDVLEFGPSSGLAIALATLGILALLTVLGLGYASVAFDDAVTAIATAPAFGSAAVSIAAVALDRIGLRLIDLPVAIGASALAGLGGLALRLVVQRRRALRPGA